MHRINYILILLLLNCTTAVSQNISNKTEIESIIISKNIAIAYLDRGLKFYSTGQWQSSIKAFSLALKKNNLNDAGKALVYWHVALCQIKLNQKNEGLEALSSFIAIGQNILDIRDTMRYAVTSTIDFVESFDLIDRLAWSRALINFTWADRGTIYGRSQENAIIAHNTIELEYFIGILKESCDGGCNFQRSLLYENGVLARPYTEMITIRGQDIVQFFVVVLE
jgi:tetratricopeptide (TPR) repeat protein